MSAQAEQMKSVTAELTNIIGGNTEQLQSASGDAVAKTSGFRKVLRLAGTGRKDTLPARFSPIKGRQATKMNLVEDGSFSDF